MHRARVQSVGVALLSILVVCPAYAQGPASSRTGEESRWGVIGSGTPSWELMSPLRELIDLEEGESINVSGSEFTIGFVRGSTRGGDWGVSFVRKPFDDGSGGVGLKQDCFNAAQTLCRPITETTQVQEAHLNGVEFHWFKPFVTIADRVQLGVNVGGGVARGTGTIVTTTDRFEPTGFGPGGVVNFRPVQEVEIEEFPSIFPLIKAEARGSVILASALKLNVAGGLNFPAYSARIGLLYLFGAR